jgi:hypothetical protein
VTAGEEYQFPKRYSESSSIVSSSSTLRERGQRLLQDLLSIPQDLNTAQLDSASSYLHVTADRNPSKVITSKEHVHPPLCNVSACAEKQRLPDQLQETEGKVLVYSEPQHRHEKLILLLVYLCATGFLLL